jgi:hypothetical protein
MPRLKERVEAPAPRAPAPREPAVSDEVGPRPRGLEFVRRLAATRWLQTLVATAAYLGFAIYLTWPLVTDLDSTIYGAIGDLTGGASAYRELAENGQIPFLPGSIADFSAPDGLEIRWTLNVLSLPEVGIAFALVKLFGPIPAVGLYTLLGFTLSGLAMFLFVRRLTRHVGVAFVAGYAFAFYPFVVTKAQGHLAYVHGWPLVLALWRLVELIDAPTRRNAVWAGLALTFLLAWTPYHILFGAVMLVALVPVAVFFAWRRGLLRPTLTALAVTGGIALAWLGGMWLLNRAAPRSEIRSHSIQEAITYSARAAEYVVPTSVHPLFGEEAGRYRASHLHGSNFAENTLYVGLTILALALAGFIWAVRRRGPPRRIAFAAVVLAIAGFAFSSPPHVDLLGVDFPTTTQLLFELTSTWRVFSRLAQVVMLGLVVLAALGLLAIVRGRPLALQGALLALALVVVAADLWARPAQGTNKIAVPETYLRLADMPKGIAVEYPLVPAAQSGYGDIFYQAWHDKPILNGYYEDSPEEHRALALSDLSERATASGLRALGVRYVLLRRDIEAAGLPDPGRPGRGFKLLTRDPYIALYEVRLPGRHGLVSPMEGFAGVEEGPAGRFQWLEDDRGTIEVRGTCSPCAGTVRMSVESFGRPRSVTVRGPDGRVLARARRLVRRTLRVPVRFDRKLELSVETEPGPQSVSELTGTADSRSVSISVRNATLTFTKQRTR